jgi:hypothetical protein
MIAKTGEVKGLDFGLAKETAAKPASSARVPIRIACSIHRGVSRIAPGDSRSGDAEMLLAMRSRLTELFVRAAMTEKSNAVLGKVWKCYIPENVVGVADNRVRIELVGALRSVNRPSSDRLEIVVRVAPVVGDLEDLAERAGLGVDPLDTLSRRVPAIRESPFEPCDRRVTI